jgi:hypothetical protein
MLADLDRKKETNIPGGEIPPPQSVVGKAKMLLSKVMNIKSLNIEDPSNSNTLEKD